MIDSTPSNANRITSIGTKRQKVQLTLKEIKFNAEKSRQCGGVWNVFDGLNHLIVGVTCAYCKTDPKS